MWLWNILENHFLKCIFFKSTTKAKWQQCINNTKKQYWLFWPHPQLRWTDTEWPCLICSQSTFQIFWGECSSKRKALSAVQPTPSLKVASMMRWSMLVPVASITHKFVVAPLTGRVWKIVWMAADFFFISDTAYSSSKIPSHILHA